MLTPDDCRSLAPEEEAIWGKFDELVEDTHVWFEQQGADFAARLGFQWITEASYFPKRFPNAPKPLLERWAEAAAEFERITAQCSKIELAIAMQILSETHASESWPCGYELLLRDWVDSGNLHPLPIWDGQKVVTPEFYARLQQLRMAVAGWLVYNYEAHVATFLPDKADAPVWSGRPTLID